MLKLYFTDDFSFESAELPFYNQDIYLQLLTFSERLDVKFNRGHETLRTECPHSPNAP
jgi:hypothetical protein